MFNAKSLLDALISAGSQAGAAGGAQPGAGGQQGGLGGLLGGLAEQMQKAGGAGGLAGMAGKILGQAGQGVQDAARDTGLQRGAGDLVGQLSGKTPEEIVAQVRGMLGSNQLAAGALLGGLGALVFGTSAGRSIAGSAAKLGGAALIGGLAYKAWQNYQAGKPMLGADDQPLLPAPRGSGFEAEATTETGALVFIRAMIAASACDGHIDDAERAAILGGLRQVGQDAEANEWLAREMANPASVDQLVEGAQSPEMAAQIYTAARIAINPDTPAEKDFLAGLAGSLGLDAELVANIDAAASAAKV